MPQLKLPDSVQNKYINRLIVYKTKRELHVFQNETLLKIYFINLGLNPIGKKQFEGDLKTPEGIYTINDKNPHSKFYKNLGISYPNEYDVEFARNSEKKPGGDIKIHGLPNEAEENGVDYESRDWTKGCISLSNTDMDELYKNVLVGAIIDIRP